MTSAYQPSEKESNYCATGLEEILDAADLKEALVEAMAAGEPSSSREARAQAGSRVRVRSASRITRYAALLVAVLALSYGAYMAIERLRSERTVVVVQEVAESHSLGRGTPDVTAITSLPIREEANQSPLVHPPDPTITDEPSSNDDALAADPDASLDDQGPSEPRTSPTVTFATALQQYLDGNKEDAVHHLESLVQAAPDQPGYYLNLGWLLLEQGEADQAIETWRTALDKDQGNTEIHHALRYMDSLQSGED